MKKVSEFPQVEVSRPAQWFPLMLKEHGIDKDSVKFEVRKWANNGHQYIAIRIDGKKVKAEKRGR